jgi:hypothetical protein
MNPMAHTQKGYGLVVDYVPHTSLILSPTSLYMIYHCKNLMQTSSTGLQIYDTPGVFYVFILDTSRMYQ